MKKFIKLSDGRKIIIETGKLAKQANGAVTVTMDNAILLSTVVCNMDNKDFDFLPLSVDYQEKFAAAGKIPGGFLKREGRLGDHEIVISRLVDRAIRPLFPKGFFFEININIILISVDFNVLPDTLAALSASSALCCSNIPFYTPVSEVRVVKIDNKFLINPVPNIVNDADINLVVGGTEDNVLMVEGEMNEISESEFISAIKFAHFAIKDQCKVQKSFISNNKLEFTNNKDLFFKESIFKDLYNRVYYVYKKFIDNKKDRNFAFNLIKENYINNNFFKSSEISNINISFKNLLNQVFRDLVLNESLRLDGRGLDEIRPIDIELNYLPSSHGSALFTRGETQSLTTVTLGNKFDEQIIDRVMQSGYNKFILHYNFPGFSTGELKSNRFSSRREIGHGNLAMMSLKRVLPCENKNPYTIRIVSDILSSNGSSSMATVCAGSLALMDAGVDIKSHVAGVSMGMIFDSYTKKYSILSDILGDEDSFGDMDFKIAGTVNGITACQMDIKLSELSYDIIYDVLNKSKKARLYILNIMNKKISLPILDYKNHVPRASVINISRDMIGAVIGTSGKVIQDIKRETGANIIVEETEKGGIVKIFASNKDSLVNAEKRIKSIILQPVIGDIYLGKVKAILHFGAFVEFMPGKDGLLHISEVKWERIETLEGVLKVGEEINVKLVSIDQKTGKYRLSRKVLFPKDNV